MGPALGRASDAPAPPGPPGWARWRPWLLGSAVATAAALVAFAADTSGPDAGILQRVAVSIPLAAITAVAVRLLSARAAG